MSLRVTFAHSVRYSTLALCTLATGLALFSLVAFGRGLPWLLLFGALTLLGVRDLFQTRHAILRNYPILGHMRFLLEFIRPEIRQYFIEGDVEAASRSRARSARWCTSAPRACPTCSLSAPSWTSAPRATSGSTTR
jgi:hypothetical protein